MSGNSHPMKSSSKKLEEAIQSRSLTSTTKALRELADELGYQLKPPYTKVLSLSGKEEGDRFTIRFEAELCLHYSGLQNQQQEGLVIVIHFGGKALADSPGPPIHELFYAAAIESVSAYGYGSRWHGKTMPTPKEYRENVEIPVDKLNEIELDELYSSAQKKR